MGRCHFIKRVEELERRYSTETAQTRTQTDREGDGDGDIRIRSLSHTVLCFS